jgi:hypothetical protein
MSLLFMGDWGLGIGDWGLGIGPNPQSPKHKSYLLLILLHFTFLFISFKIK